MRILHLDHGRALGGAERSILELASAEILRGHDSAIAVGRTGAFSEAIVAAGLPWFDMRWPGGAVATSADAGMFGLLAGSRDLLSAARSVRSVARRFRADVVIAHTRKTQVAASLGLMFHPVVLVWHFHEAVPPRALVRQPLRLASLRANGSVALTRWHAGQYVAAHIPLRGPRPTIVGDSVDVAALRAVAPGWPDVARPPVVGFVGSISRMKAPHLLIDAAELLPPGAATFRIFGEVQFPESEAAYGQWFQQRLETSPARDRIEWVGAVASPAQAFAQIDLLVHCSVLPEPFGRVIVEAMAARRPVVAFRFGAPLELLDDESAEFAATPDGDGIARAITQLLADPGAAQAKAARAQVRADRFSPDALAERMTGVYEGLLCGS